MMKNQDQKKEQKEYFNIYIPGCHGDPAEDAITKGWNPRESTHGLFMHFHSVQLGPLKNLQK